MKPTLPSASKILGSFALMLALMPAVTFAQAGAGAGAGGGRGQAGMMGGAGMAQQLQKVLDQLDLSDDQKPKIEAIMKKTQADVREVMQGMQDADPQERRTKTQEIMKMMADSKDQIEKELTPDQLKKFFPLNAKMLLKRATDSIAGMKTASAKLDVSEDVKKQLTGVFDDTDKTLDGYKTDADAISDQTSENDFQQKLVKVQVDVAKQLRDILGQEDAQKLQQAGRQAAGGGAGAGGRGQGAGGGGQGLRRRLNGGSRSTTRPTTLPDAN